MDSEKIRRYFNLRGQYVAKLKAGASTAYQLDKYLYVMDSEKGRKIACYPSFCGDEMMKATLDMARDFVLLLKEMGYLDQEVLLLNVLRAAPGYGVRDALIESGARVSESWIRPYYLHPSYRLHTVKDLGLKFEQYSSLKPGSYTLIKPDTEATGFTTLFSLDRFLTKCESHGCSVDRLILYGFIADRGLELIRRTFSSRVKEIIAFAIEDLTPLARNGYDMPAYGIDLSALEEVGERVYLAARAPDEVVDALLLSCYPGMDQPGDWSERQTRLFDGEHWTEVDPKIHLKRSQELLTRLRKAQISEPWYQEEHEKIYEMHMMMIEDALSALQRGFCQALNPSGRFRISSLCRQLYIL
ncbi:MAG: hypothetical protein ACP5UU_04925 [Thermoprotei archaeon]